MHDIARIERELQETVAAMSADAREAWEEIERIGKRDAFMDKAKAVFLGTDPSTWDDLNKAVALKAQLMGALAEEAAGKQSLAKQILAAMYKARELDPSLPEKGLTVREAIAVLERRGVKHGISREALEMKL